MLTRIGRPDQEPGLVGLLLECHGRIRKFSALARRLAEHPEAAEDEVRDAATRISSYFGRALPAHVRDEEDSILPRLRGRSAELDRALADMHDQHGGHEADLGRLVDLCEAMREGRRALGELAPELGPLAASLERELLRHLELEERVIFPAIRTHLDAADQDAIVRELRERRQAGEG